MKLIIKPMFLAFYLALSMMACNNEELFIEPTLEVNNPEVKPGNEDADTGAPNNLTSCDFTLDAVKPNSTVIINCIVDLQGKTTDLPANVNIVYEGGEITNGTLNFSNNTVISGELMNSSLAMVGNMPQLKDPVFTFEPKRWGIVEGKVSDAVALNNRKILNNTINMVKKYGVSIFKIDAMDAYFDVKAPAPSPNVTAENAILLPSNFELQMTGNTYLRVQPNGKHSYNLIAIYKGQNIKVSGGNLFGDRWTHNYSPDKDSNGNDRNTHEWGHVLQISGGVNIEIDGVNIADASGDGFGVHGSTVRNTDGTVRSGEFISSNITLRNSTITASRRNGLSLLDGDAILIENCNVKDTGLGESASGAVSSAGTSPRAGVSFEAWRQRAANGDLMEYERITNVILRGNKFTGNENGDISLYTASYITIENNFFDGYIGHKASNNITIKNNTFKGRLINGELYPFAAVLLSSKLFDPQGNNFNFNYTVSGNSISGYKNAIIASGGENYIINNNTLSNFKTGITLGDLKNSQFYSNNMNSDAKDSFGYASFAATINSVSISNEYVNVTRRPIDLYNVIAADTNKKLSFNSCQFISQTATASLIQNCKNISITNSTINTNITNNGSTNVTLNGKNL